MTKFIVDGPNKKGRYHVIEGWVMPGNVFNVKRFICEICSQETDKEMVEIANLIQKGLTAYTDLTDYHEDEENP